jgi:hypothetical protein
LINHIFQPPGSSLCGQTCVAMIAGITLDDSIEAFGGKKGGTRTKDVVAALQKLGINCGDPPLTRFNGDCFTSDTCIVKLRFEESNHSHWTLWHEGRYYDPDEYAAYIMNKSLNGNKYWEGVRPTSYLPIFMSEEAHVHG